MKKRKPSGLLVIVVDPETKLTEWSQIAHEGWAVVDIHVAADADTDTVREAETGRRILDHMGVPLIAVTVDENGIDAEHLGFCLNTWGVRSPIEVRVPEPDVAHTRTLLKNASIRAAVIGIPAPLDDDEIIAAPGSVFAELGAAPRRTNRGTTLLAIATSAIVSTHDGASPSIVEEVVAHGAGGWVEIADGALCLADWWRRMQRVSEGDDVRLTLVVGDADTRDPVIGDRLRLAIHGASGTVMLRDGWAASELAHGLARTVQTHLDWAPERVVIVIREDQHFEDELRRAWAGIGGVTSDLHLVRVDPHLGLIEKDIIEITGADAAEELAVLEAWDTRDTSGPL